MKRVLPILASILLGALAVGLGMGLYLKLANDDRERLAKDAEAARQALEQVKLEGQKTVDQANEKITQATSEVEKMQAQLKSMQNERDLLARAQVLSAPTGKALKGWKDAIDVPLSISIKYPAGNHTETTDAQSLTIVTDAKASNTLTATDARWLSITPYDARLEQELLATLATSTPVSFTVHGRLLIGEQGQAFSSSANILILRVRSGGDTTHLIWLREPAAVGTHSLLLDILSTLNFAQ